jgi:tRNA A37 threonylcarbamoyladenosine dehydratase
MVEDGHLEAETLVKVYALYAERKQEGVTSCNVKVQGSGGTGGWKLIGLIPIQR